MTKTPPLIVAVLIPALLACGSREYSTVPARELVRTVGYDLDIRIDYAQETIEADCMITVANPFDHPVHGIPLVLYRLMRVASVRDERGNDLPFSQQVLSYEDWARLQVNFIEIELDKPLRAGEKTSLNISYNGYLAGYAEAGMPYVMDRVDPKYTIIRPDCWAYPQVGVPSWKTNRAAGLQEFDYRVRVTVPDSLTAANGGRLVEKTSREGQATYVYENMLPAWRIDIAVADYGLLEDPAHGMRVFYFQPDEEGAHRVLQAMKDCMELYANWFGPLAARSGFSVIAVPEGFGSQADVSAVLQTRDAFLDPKRLVELYHELSHLWNVRPLDPLPPRFESEGLAMFLQYLTQEKLEDRPGRLESAARWTFDSFRKACRENPRLLEIPMIDYGSERLTNHSYSKGMLFFYFLYRMAGEEPLLEAIGSVYQTYHDSGASAREFLAHLESRLGLELDSFFQAWIFSTEAAWDISSELTLDEIAGKYAAVSS